MRASKYKKQILMILVIIAVIIAGWLSITSVKQRFIETAAEQSQSTLRLAVAGLRGELSRYEYLPTLIAENPDILRLLSYPDDTALITSVNKHLKQITKNVGASDIYVMNIKALTIASSNYDTPISFINKNFSYRPYYQIAVKGGLGRYFALGSTSLKRGYYFAAPVIKGGVIKGIITVKINVDEFETAWSGNENEIIVTDQHGIIFMSSRRDWLFKTLNPLNETILAGIKQSRQYPVDRLIQLDMKKANHLVKDIDLVTISTKKDQQQYISKQMPMPEAGWKVHILAPTTSAVTQAYITIFSITLTALLILLFTAYFYQRRAQLVERIQSQKQAQEQLEKRVKDRTSDLNDANEKLRQEIEERSAAERRLRKTQKDLIQAGKLAALGQMSAALSHELNQPLSAVKSYADNAITYLSRNHITEAGENIKRISELTDRMTAISKHLRNFARKPKEKIGPVPLALVINDAIEIMSGKLKLRSTQIQIDMKAEALWVEGGQVRLQQVLVNLFSNALDATADQASATIELTVQSENNQVNIMVRDHGPGLENEVLEKIFDPFFTTKAINKGLGLGLSISYNIIRDFGGHLSAYNHPEQGAVFVIRLKQAKIPQGISSSEVQN